jgi:hypothetical protein
MADEPAYVRDLRRLAGSDPTVENLEAVESELYFSKSDRATVIMYGQVVETNLQRLIYSIMRQDMNSSDKRRLFEYEGSFGTFSAKIIGAYALNLIGPTTKFDLDLLRFIRNQFAHSRVHLNFSMPEVTATCNQFKLVDLTGSHIPLAFHEGAFAISEADGRAAIDKTNSKTRYIVTCHTLSQRFYMRREPERMRFDPSLISTLLP